MSLNYNSTIKACFIGYIIQSIVNNFVPLLFVTFQNQFGIPLSEITILITLNFSLQLLVDFAAAFFIDKIGYRTSAVIAHLFSATGLILLSFLPSAMNNHLLGVIISVVFYAAGGGLLEVIISPLVESCPSEHKEKTMSMLHSFYCWGTAGVIILSTIAFNLFGIENWAVIAAAWAVVPVINSLFFLKVPITEPSESSEEGLSLKSLLKTKMFWIFIIIMCCSGASEQAVSQWASTFTEKALGISKSVSDLIGPALFSIMMGSSRAIYGKFGDKIDLSKMMLLSTIMCIASYAVIVFSASAFAGLVGIALSGFAVGILWPGSFSKSVVSIKGGGSAMFAFLALAGDVGCAAGPTFAGKIASIAGDNLKTGLLAAIIFPLILLVLLFKSERTNGGKSYGHIE